MSNLTFKHINPLTENSAYALSQDNQLYYVEGKTATLVKAADQTDLTPQDPKEAADRLRLHNENFSPEAPAFYVPSRLRWIVGELPVIQRLKSAHFALMGLFAAKPELEEKVKEHQQILGSEIDLREIALKVDDQDLRDALFEAAWANEVIEFVIKRDERLETQIATLSDLIDQVFSDHPEQVEQAKTDKRLIGFLLGQSIKEAKQANEQFDPAVLNQLIQERFE